jgi:hypothetical protein
VYTFFGPRPVPPHFRAEPVLPSCSTILLNRKHNK